MHARELFKLAVRLWMSGSSKNSDWWRYFFFVHLSFFRILKLLCYLINEAKMKGVSYEVFHFEV